ASEFRAAVRIGQIPRHLMDHARDLLHLVVVDPLGAILRCVVAGMQPGVERYAGDAAVEERPVIAAAHQLRNVVVVAIAQVEAGGRVRLVGGRLHVCAAGGGGEVDGVVV